MIEHAEPYAVVPHEAAPVATPMPVFGGEQMGEALRAYKGLQATLDKAMPDAIMEIQGRPFRKKAYWRAVRTAFQLKVVQVHEERVETPDDWGYIVTYRATAPNGAEAEGDGACMASEKHAKQATVHNVRSHAHTRAFNRAVSNLVGFGEVSAEEMIDEVREHHAEKVAKGRARQGREPGDDETDEDDDPVMKFGKHKGSRLSEVPEEYLSWLADKLAKDLEDPEKAKYESINKRRLMQIENMLDRRSKGA